MHLLAEREGLDTRWNSASVFDSPQRHRLCWRERAALPKTVPGVARDRHHGVDEANCGEGVQMQSSRGLEGTLTHHDSNRLALLE